VVPLHYNFAVEGAVGFYVDDVFHSTVFGSLFDLLDVQRVEVLRGPQGTLFGKNSIGGAIRVISNEPTGDGSASFRVTTGSYNRFEVRGHSDISLIEDKAALRIAANMRQRDGYMDVYDFACVNPTLTGTGEAPLSYALRQRTTADDCKVGDLGSEEVFSGRATLKIDFSEDLSLTVGVESSKDGGDSGAYKVIEQPDYDADTLPGFLPAQNQNEFRIIPNFGVPYDERFLTDDMYSSYATFDADFTGFHLPDVSEVNSSGMRAVVDWTIAENLALKSITAYKEYDGEFNRDGDQSPLDMGNSRTTLEHEQLSQEFRLSGVSFNEGLEWTLGAFYFDSEGRDQSDIHIWNLWFWELPTVLRTDDPVENETKALFGQGVFSLTEKLDLSFGLRYSDESKSYSYERIHVAEFRNGQPFLERKTPDPINYDRVDWKVGLDYQATDEVMIYGLVSTGYRGGGFNPRPLFENQITKVKPEDLTSYEIGFKSDLLDDTLRFNLTAFYGEYTDLQQTASGPDPINEGATVIARTNIGEAEIQGIEAELVYRPIENFTLTGSYGYTDYEYKELGSAADVSGGPCLECKPVRVPKYTYNLNAEYDVPMADKGNLTFGSSYSYRDRVFYDQPNTLAYSQEGFGLLSARISWVSADETWEATVNVTNATEEEYFGAIGVGSSAGTAGTPGRPREWSFSIGRQF